ncbi:hypothetical protein M1N58_01385, partial [Dehalococcoidales bacterium]|nr:hypothetical protein [Dehalococcoidales bacterium]
RLVKKVTLLILLSLGIIFGYLFYISGAVSFLIAKYLSGKTVGEKGRLKSLFIPWGKYKIHLHHWFISSWIMGVTLVKDIYLLSPPLFYGFLGGLVFHGIYCYRDWYKILIPRELATGKSSSEMEAN